MDDVTKSPRDAHDAIIDGLVKLIAWCEREGLDFELMAAEGRRVYDGEPESGT
jgi:hypothetical protein